MHILIKDFYRVSAGCRCRDFQLENITYSRDYSLPIVRNPLALFPLLLILSTRQWFCNTQIYTAFLAFSVTLSEQCCIAICVL